MNIKVTTELAIETLTENRNKHQEEYEVQIKGWQKVMEWHSDKMKKWVESGGVQASRPKEPVKPDEFTDEYNEMINRLEYHQDVYIELDEYEFDKIINNEFGWKTGFLANSATYTGMVND